MTAYALRLGDVGFNKRTGSDLPPACGSLKGCLSFVPLAPQIPKAFKLIPKLRLWDEVLFLTSPQTWSPQATFYATRLFIANLNEKLVSVFLKRPAACGVCSRPLAHYV